MKAQPNTTNDEPNEVFERAMKFANDCGTVALTTRNPETLKKLYIEFATDIEALLSQKELEARIDEVKNHILKSLVGSGEPKSTEIIWKRLQELNSKREEK